MKINNKVAVENACYASGEEGVLKENIFTFSHTSRPIVAARVMRSLIFSVSFRVLVT